VAGDAVDVLRLVPLLADLDDDEMILLADAMQPVTFGAGDLVTAEGAAADGFFVVESGDAAVSIQGEDRGAMGAGDCFGEVALLTGSERTATIRAISEMRCYRLAADDFRDIVENSPLIAWKLMQSLTDRMS
jgi:CRP-like cAMP-binding protein